MATEANITIKISTQAKKVMDSHLEKYPVYSQIGFASQAILDAVKADEKRLNRKISKK